MTAVAVDRPKVAFLFAAHNPVGRIDEADFIHLELLSGLGDVYYMSSGSGLHWKDINRLSSTVRMVRAETHSELDFGSWKRLIRAIGYTVLEVYDEIYFVNNSLVPVAHPQVFLDKFRGSNAEFFAPMVFDEHYRGQDSHAEDFLSRPEALTDNVMFPSFFWGFKKRLFQQSFVREFFESVKLEKNRLDVCYRYERGFSRIIIKRSIVTCLFYEFVHKNVPVYTETAFHLARLGFPYVKRKLFSGDFYHIDYFRQRVDGLIEFVDPSLRGMLVRTLTLAGVKL